MLHTLLAISPTIVFRHIEFQETWNMISYLEKEIFHFSNKRTFFSWKAEEMLQMSQAKSLIYPSNLSVPNCLFSLNIPIRIFQRKTSKIETAIRAEQINWEWRWAPSIRNSLNMDFEGKNVRFCKRWVQLIGTFWRPQWHWNTPKRSQNRNSQLIQLSTNIFLAFLSTFFSCLNLSSSVSDISDKML